MGRKFKSRLDRNPALKRIRNDAFVQRISQLEGEKADIERQHETLKLDHDYTKKENQILKRELQMHKAREAKMKKAKKGAKK